MAHNVKNGIGDRLGTMDLCSMCGAAELNVRFVYEVPPALETSFPLQQGEQYWRELYRCDECGHFVERFDLDQTRLYQEEYVSSLYKNDQGVLAKFNFINSLPKEKSDNANRVEFVNNYARAYIPSTKQLRLLDIGAGLGVFPAGMKKQGWDCTAVDMDQRLVDHYIKNIKIKGVLGGIDVIPDIGKFDLVSLVKVLEHVYNPTSMLEAASNNLNVGGLIYIELPDAEAAEMEGPEREEFFLGHQHVFSFLSFVHLVKKSGLMLLFLERLREPSSKFTLRGFACKRLAGR